MKPKIKYLIILSIVLFLSPRFLKAQINGEKYVFPEKSMSKIAFEAQNDENALISTPQTSAFILFVNTKHVAAHKNDVAIYDIISLQNSAHFA